MAYGAGDSDPDRGLGLDGAPFNPRAAPEVGLRVGFLPQEAGSRVVNPHCGARVGACLGGVACRPVCPCAQT